LPELAPKAAGQSPADIKRYPDQPLLNEQKLASGLASVRQEKIALIPTRSGSYRLPPMEIPWWNTKTDRMEIARLPERILTVLPGARTEETAPSAVATSGPESSPAAAQPAPAPAEAPRAAGGAWFWLALLFGLGWLGTAAAWWLSGKPRKSEVPQPADDPRSSHSAINALRVACQKNNPAEARQALLDWARQRRPSAPPIGLDELKSRCGVDLRREIEQLNQVLYRDPASDWQGQTLWSAFRSDPIALSNRDKPTITADLEPLYKL
jgi:hypothetical protein